MLFRPIIPDSRRKCNQSPRFRKSASTQVKHIQRQRKKGKIPIFLTVSGHQKKEQHHQQIFGIKILWQHLPEKAENAGSRRRRSVLRGCLIPGGMPKGLPSVPLGLSIAARLLGGRRWAALGSGGSRLGVWRLLRRFAYAGRPLALRGMVLGRGRIRQPVSPVRAVRLGNVAVIHRVHLPVRSWSPPALRKPDAALASFAARIARSSFWIRPWLKYGERACSRACWFWSAPLWLAMAESAWSICGFSSGNAGGAALWAVCGGCEPFL